MEISLKSTAGRSIFKLCRISLTARSRGSKLITVTIFHKEDNIADNRKYNRSKQRDRILALLQENGSHPSADWLYTRLKDEFPNLSVGTIYRNLNILIDQGLINKIEFGSTFDRFDANLAPHYHFICNRCGSITDLDLPIDSSLNSRVNEQTQHTALQHKIEFYGLCDRCSQEE